MSDPAPQGKFEVPGGHLEQGETPRAAALREFQEETGLPIVDGEWTGTWTSANGIYQGFVYTIPREADLDIFDRQLGSDPDGDCSGTETIAWWNPADLPGNPAVRPELLENIGAVMTALGCNEGAAGDCCGADCCAGGCCGGDAGCQCGTGGVLKAAEAAPKGRERHWPGWDLDLKAVGHWAPLLAAALSAALSKTQAERIARAYIAEHPEDEDAPRGKREAVEAAAAWLAGQGIDLVPAITPLVPGILSDAHLIGGVSAAAMADGGSADPGGWQPGDTDTARQRTDDLGLGAGLSAALASSGQVAQQMAGGYMTALGRALVDGQSAGLGATAIGASLIAALSDPDTASGSVLGQLVTGIAAAARAVYLKLKVQRVNWLTDPSSNVCATCLEYEAASPYRIEAAPACPAHFRCRCQIVPASTGSPA